MASEAVERSIANSFRGTIPIFPPQGRGFNVGSILTLKHNITTNRGIVREDWFNSTFRSIKTYYPQFEAPSPERMDDIIDFGASSGVSSAAAASVAPASVAPASAAAASASTSGDDMGVSHDPPVSSVVAAAPAPAAAAVSGQRGAAGTCTLGLTAGYEVLDGTDDLDRILNIQDVYTRMLQSNNCKNDWMDNGRAVVCVITQCYRSKRLQSTEESEADQKNSGDYCGRAVRLDSLLDMTGSSSNSVKRVGAVVEGTFAITLSFFKVAKVDDDNYYSHGPVAAIGGSDCRKIREAASWFQTGGCLFSRLRPSAVLEGMTRMATYISAVQLHDWQSSVDNTVSQLASMVGVGLDDNETIIAASFTVTNDNGPADDRTACTKVHNIVKNRNDNNNNAAPDASFTSSMNIVLAYDHSDLSYIFNRWENEGRVLDLGDGWRLKAIRVALQFNPNRLGILPVYLPENIVRDAETPSKVLRYLKDGSLLLTPVEGLQEKDVGKMGKIFGNGDCEDWNMKQFVEFTADPGQIQALQGMGYIEVRRCKDDIDFHHKSGQSKMVRYVLKPPIAQAGRQQIPDLPPAVVAPAEHGIDSLSAHRVMGQMENVQHVEVDREQDNSIRSPGRKKNAAPVSPVRRPGQAKKQKLGDSNSLDQDND